MQYGVNNRISARQSNRDSYNNFSKTESSFPPQLAMLKSHSAITNSIDSFHLEPSSHQAFTKLVAVLSQTWQYFVGTKPRRQFESTSVGLPIFQQPMLGNAASHS